MAAFQPPSEAKAAGPPTAIAVHTSVPCGSSAAAAAAESSARAAKLPLPVNRISAGGRRVDRAPQPRMPCRAQCRRRQARLQGGFQTDRVRTAELARPNRRVGVPALPAAAPVALGVRFRRTRAAAPVALGVRTAELARPNRRAGVPAFPGGGAGCRLASGSDPPGRRRRWHLASGSDPPQPVGPALRSAAGPTRPRLGSGPVSSWPRIPRRRPGRATRWQGARGGFGAVVRGAGRCGRPWSGRRGVWGILVRWRRTPCSWCISVGRQRWPTRRGR
jgi:hypothetical protein